MSTYQTGNGPQQVRFSADISTIGLAATRASVAPIDGSSSPIGVAHSKDATGDVAMVEIGSAASSVGHKLIIMTKIDIAAIPKEEDRRKEYNRIQSSFLLNGGVEGLKSITTPDIKEHSDNYKVVILYTEIEFNS